MIVVTGATGALNGATVDHLLERFPADEIAVAVRDVGQGRSGSPSAGSASAAATTPTRPRCRARSRAPTSCCWCRRATRAPTP